MRRLVLAASLVAVALPSLTCGGGEEKNPFSVKSEVVTKADRPRALAFAPDGRLFYAEHFTGSIRIVTPDGKLLADPFAQLTVQTGLQWGLTGLAIDPAFADNHYVYAYYTQPAKTGPPGGAVTARPVVTRFTDRDNKGVDAQVIVADLPETDPRHPGYNASGQIHFGPEGDLYVSIGDYDLALAEVPSQDLSTPQGKLLRVNKGDGSRVSGNPFAGQPGSDPRIYAYGFRESFPFAFHPKTGQLYGTDNTPVSCEELNLITSGGNYGYPKVGEFPFADCRFGSHTHGMHFFAKKDTAPESFLSNTYVSGLAFVSGTKYPTVGDALLVCESEQETHDLRRLTFGGPNLDQVVADDVVVKDCNMDVAVSPDGTIFYSNENEIRRLVFEPAPTEH